MKQTSLNFGAIRDSVIRHAGKEIMSENGQKTTILNSFMKSVKDNPALKLQYLVFKNIEDGNFSKERLAERYIAQNMKILEGLSWDKVIESNRALRIGLLENSHVEGNKDREALYENIHTLIESTIRESFVNIDISEAAYESVLAHLLKEKTENKQVVTEENDNPKLLSWNFITKLAVNNFNERYAHLNENEKSLLKILLSTEDNKKNHLQDLKAENTKLIDELLSEGVSDKAVESSLNMFKEKLITIVPDGNLDESIINCSELKEELLEMKK
jgi:hypothetical protein